MTASAPPLRDALEDYLMLRRALGFKLASAARLLGHRTSPGKGRSHRRAPAIETYRQVSGSTAAGRRLAALQDLYRVRPQPRRRPEAVS